MVHGLAFPISINCPISFPISAGPGSLLCCLGTQFIENPIIAAHGLALFNNGENLARTLDILRYSASMMLETSIQSKFLFFRRP